MRLKRFEADEKARKAADLEHMIREFETIASDLDRQIQAEEDRSGVRDPSHFAYSTFAKSASQRRDNLRASIAGLREKLEAALRERDEAADQAVQTPPTPLRVSGRMQRRADRLPTSAVR